MKQMIPQQQLQQGQLQQSVPSQFEITSISCTTGNNENEEKSSRFRRVKIETEKNKETNPRKYSRGRWSVNDYYDAPDSITKTSDTKNEQVISTNNYTSNTFQSIQNSIPNQQQLTSTTVSVSQSSHIVSNLNYNNLADVTTGINTTSNSNKLIQQDKQILINTTFEPLTTSSANNEFINNISPPLAQTINNNTNTISQSNLEDKQQQNPNASKSPPLYVPTPISTAPLIGPNTINNLDTIQATTNNFNVNNAPLLQHSQINPPLNDQNSQLAPIASNVIIGSKNSVFQTQSVTQSKQNTDVATLNQQQLQGQQSTNITQPQVQQQQQPLLQTNQSNQSLLQFQQAPLSNLQFQNQPSDNSVNTNINLSPPSNLQLNSQQLNNNNPNIVVQPHQQYNLMSLGAQSNYQQNQSQLPNYNNNNNGSSTAPILNLSQKQPFAAQFSSQHVSPKEQSTLTTTTNTIGLTSSASSITTQQSHVNNSISLLTTSTNTTSGFKDFLNLASTKTSSSSSSSTNDLLNEAYEMLNKKPSNNHDGENEKKNDSTAGIHNRIELAMDLVKSHLTNAVKEEIICLKSHIEKLNERCARLEEENRVFRQYATSEVLMLVDRPPSTTIQQNNSNNFILNQTQSTNFSSSATSASSSSSVSSAMIAANVLNNNISATMSPSASSVTENYLNTSGDDNNSMSELLVPTSHNSNSMQSTNVNISSNNSNNNINNNANNSVFNENSMNISCDDNINNNNNN